MLIASKWRARMFCAISSKSVSSTWSGVHELSEEECLQTLFQNYTNELYDKRHYVSLKPSSLLSITHLRKSTECPRNTPSKVNQSDHHILNLFGEQGLYIGESTRLPPMWPGLKLLVLYSFLRGFPPSTPVFPSHQKPTFDLICRDSV